VDDLFLFIRESSADLALAGNAALMGALPPGPRSLSLWANGPRHDMRHAAAGLLALWHRPPLRLPSGRAVSCVRRAILTCEALGASHFSQSKSKIRFCSDSMSGFAPVLSGFAPAPTQNYRIGNPSIKKIRPSCHNSDTHRMEPSSSAGVKRGERTRPRVWFSAPSLKTELGRFWRSDSGL
jgi:hypothetical protein